MLLSNEVETQLQEILINRPNEEKEPVRKRNKKKDVSKNINRGNGHNIERFIIDKQLAPLIDSRINELKLDGKVIYMTQLPAEEKVYYIKEMLNNEELKKLYPECSVTQTKKQDIVELVARKYRWALTPMSFKPYEYTVRNSVVISSSIPDVDNIYKRKYKMSDIEDIKLLPFIHTIDDSTLSRIVSITKSYHAQVIENNVHLNKHKYIDKESAEILRLIESNKGKSNWFNKEEIHIRRNELNAYIKKELERNGDFGKLDNRVDLFQTREYIY